MESCEKDDVSEILSIEETNDLLRLREEEKLARDVYLYAYDKYELKIFKNISNSEQRHMDDVLEILSVYNISDPASSERGVFDNEILQGLYNNLTAKSDISLTEALIVGATIEDIDIYDINEFILRTEKHDILDMYNKLNCGSRNHLRAYYSQILLADSYYSAQYISTYEFDNIISGEHESCAN